MKILAVNGSPRGAGGNTEVILQAFLSGAQEAGAETEVVYLKDKNIKHCIGCFTCWTKTPGVCIHKDDMPDLMEKMKDQDVMVYAFPLYIFTFPGLFKDFMDRLLPFAQPLIEKRGDHYIHPPRWGKGMRRSVLISNAGFSETHHFDGLKKTFELLNDGPDNELLGTICCAAGPLLSIPEFKDEVQVYLDAARKAGAAVVREGKISSDLHVQLNRSLAPDSEAYANMVNSYWASLGVEKIENEASDMKAHETKGDRVLSPPSSVETIHDLIAAMPLAFKSEAAGDLEVAFQFEITDEDPSAYYLTIKDGICTAYEGTHPNPDATIRTPADVWLKISRGQMNGATAFMTGKYKVTGNLQLLMKMERLFSRPE